MWRAFRAILLLACLSVGQAGAHAQTPRRVALIIGNGAYASVPRLANPANDAEDMAAAFTRLGFAVSHLRDARHDEMRKGLLEFGRSARGAEIAAVFFAGHGIEVGGENWLIPTDAELRSDTDVEHEAISLRGVIAQVAGATKLGLVILDACRNNPFAAKMQRSVRVRAVETGLARTEPSDNVLVAYAARDGTTASDGEGRNSPYTAALLRRLETPGREISFVFRDVRDDVMAATRREQQPFVYGSLSSEAIYLVPGPAAGALAGSARDHAAGTASGRPQSAASAEPRLVSPPRPDTAVPVTECDRLAAVAYDPDGAGLPGVPLAQIDIVPALTACEEAVRQHPGVARFQLQSGRIAEAQKDFTRARQLYERAERLGSSSATVALGELYESGSGAAKDLAAARRHFERAAAAGNTRGMVSLGILYALGNGVAKDPVQARLWFEKAAAGENGLAMNALGNVYKTGLGAPVNLAEARKYYELSAALGEGVGMYNLGSLYSQGAGVPRDPRTARLWYEKAAALNSRDAMWALGTIYRDGNGAPRNRAEARQWFEKAASLGDVTAMNDLGVMFHNGVGVPRDYTEAWKWYEKAASAGSGAAMFNLGLLFENGLGVRRDRAEARRWYEKAVAAGNENARARLRGLR